MCYIYVYRNFQRWRKGFGWADTATNTQGAYLDWDHPDMVAMRFEERERMQGEKIRPELFLNYDQLWTVNYRRRKRCGFKDPKFVGYCKGKKHTRKQKAIGGQTLLELYIYISDL